MAMLLSFRASEQTTSSSVRTSKNRRSSASRSSLRFSKGIEVFDLSTLLNDLPPNTGPLGDVSTHSTANKNLSHVPCKFFKQGICQAGKSCPFSHNVDGTLSADKLPCKYFQKGNCKFGMKCALAHISPDGTRLNPKNTLSFRRPSERYDCNSGPSKHNSIHTFQPSSNGKSLGLLTQVLDEKDLESEEYAFAMSPPNFISVSTSALLRDSNYFNADAIGIHSTQETAQVFTNNDWLYNYDSKSLRRGSDIPFCGSMSSSHTLLMCNMPIATSESITPGAPNHSPSQNKSSGRRDSLSQHWSSSTSPLFDMSLHSQGDFAIVDDDDDAVSEDTYYEDYIPASLGNLIFTPQEKKRRDSRSQSGTLLERPDIYLDSLVETGL